MAIDPFANCNYALSSDDCTLDTCCLAQSSFTYRPDLGGNIFFAVFFGILLIPQLGLGIYYKTWGVLIGMICGLVLEVVGYAGRVLLHNNPFNDNAFLLYLITLTIAPVFISAAIYLTLSRLITVYGVQNSHFAPRTVAITFMCSDFLSLVLQAAGGAIADIADHGTPLEQSGIDTMIAGLILQAVSLTAFLLVCADFAWCSRDRSKLDPASEKASVRERPFFKAFLLSLLLGAILVLIRSIFRVAELWGGFDGGLWNNEKEFLILDGAMMALACLLLTILHPGAAFLDQWQAANWSLRIKKGHSSKAVDSEVSSSVGEPRAL